MKIQDRKLDHIKICLKKNVERGSTGFEDVKLIHSSLPEVDFNSIKLETKFLGKKINYPIVIEAMTGGCKEAERINKTLASVAQELGIAFGVGSQRAAIKDNSLSKTYYVRDVAPDIFLIGNMGLLPKMNVEKYQEAIDMIDADALAIHLNPLQEIAQPEGDIDWNGGLERIKKICKHVNKPVIVKETGAGINASVAIKLEDSGVSVIDVSGYGGTNWLVVEEFRSKKNMRPFEEWGIPTAVSLYTVHRVVGVPVIASGGIRNGLDAAKALVMGADMVGVAQPLLREVVKGRKYVLNWLKNFIDEIKTAFFLIGAKNLNDARNKQYVILGRTKEWIEQL
ncbi:MAG: type 2 isopentenyl-diphosphate Delta-isomerase [Candidatus Aenigmarchaeota archaeon]|nr:type 2 isopentenyl-diphosphate Delta-isomerase [Candidatus Aenigmarchaeota archaeon]